MGTIKDVDIISVFPFFFWRMFWFFFFQSVLILKEPKNTFLVEIYECQWKRIQAIVDEILGIEELSEVWMCKFDDSFL